MARKVNIDLNCDQTTIIANDNLTINTGNNTDLKGGLIASKTDNLTINTKMLTFSDIIDSESSESSGVGFSTNIGIGSSSNPNSTNPNQDRSYYPNGSTSLSLRNQGYEKEQITRATIGGGTINITDSDNSDNLAELNRDIAKSQEITKDTITAALDVSATIDNRFFDPTGKGQKEIWKEAKNLPGNLPKIPGSPVRVSRYIDKNNNTINKNTGKIKDNPAPTLVPGLFMKDSEMGRDYDRDEATNQKIVPSFPSSLLSGTKANPVFKFLNHVFPGGKSGTEYHDAGMTHKKGEQKKGELEKAVTIFPYFLLNYYGAAGTILDAPNWKKNFLPQKDNKQINQLNNINNGNKNKQNE